MLTLVNCVVLVVLFYIIRWLWHVYIIYTAERQCSLPLPPGSVGLPFIGEMLEMVLATPFGKDFFSERRRQYGNIYKTHVMGRPTIRVVGSAYIRQVLQADTTSVDISPPATVRRLLGTYSLITTTARTHRAKRKVVMKAFTTKALAGYATALNRVIKDEISGWKGRHLAYDIIQHLAARAAWEVLVGLRDFQHFGKTVVEDSKLFLNGFWTLPVPIPGTAFYKAEAAKQRLTSLIVDEYRRRQTGDFDTLDFHDALSLILGMEEEKGTPLPEDEAVGIIREFLFAGHTTTSSAGTSIIMYLAQNQHVLNKIVQELQDHNLMDEEAEVTYNKVANLTYLGDVISETLRLAPPAGGGYRKALTTLEIGGYQVPKGWAIIFSIFDTHEVSELFEEDRSAFQPERWQVLRNNPELAYSYVPFGAGPRACAGKEYAKLLLRIFTVHLVRTYDWELENKDVVMLRFPARHPKDHLPVVFRTRPNDIGTQHWNHKTNPHNHNNNELNFKDMVANDQSFSVKFRKGSWKSEGTK